MLQESIDDFEERRDAVCCFLHPNMFCLSFLWLVIRKVTFIGAEFKLLWGA